MAEIKNPLLEKVNIAAYNAIKLEEIIHAFCIIQDEVIDDNYEDIDDEYMDNCLEEYKLCVQQLTLFKDAIKQNQLPVAMFTQLDPPVRQYIYDKI